jgi:hypothetical protein
MLISSTVNKKFEMRRLTNSSRGFWTELGLQNWNGGVDRTHPNTSHNAGYNHLGPTVRCCL